MPIMRDTAAQKLTRILYLLPAAAQNGGASLAELAEALGTTPKQVARDAAAAERRTYYQPAGQAGEANVLLDGERVFLETPGHFRRPARLQAREAAALGLGLRSLALESAPERRARLLALAEVLERSLSLPGAAEAARERVVTVHGENGGSDAYEQLKRAATLQRRCRIRYLKVGASEPEVRTIDPYALLHAERWWYAVSFCHDRQDVRLFRTDRVLQVELLAERFTVPEDFDAARYAPEGRAFVAAETEDAVVRYSPRIARWICERYPEAEVEAGGAVVVQHGVADARWLVRHVLQYGADAEVIAPAVMRAVVRETVRRRGGAAAGA
jgi:predicted DNA-binding transcriptional regulator YafY